MYSLEVHFILKGFHISNYVIHLNNYDYQNYGKEMSLQIIIQNMHFIRRMVMDKKSQGVRLTRVQEPTSRDVSLLFRFIAAAIKAVQMF